MKKRKMRIYGLLAAFVICLCIGSVCFSAEEEDVWGDEQGKFELTDEAIERIMNRIEESNPEKAQELEQLREKNPEKFEKELRKVMRDLFSKRNREEQEKGRRDERGRRGARAVKETPPEHPQGEGFGRARRRDDSERSEAHREYFRRRQEDYIEWLKENYPDEAERLVQLQEKEPDLYYRNLMVSIRRYGRIKEASEENPELAEILKGDLELKKERDRLLRKISETEDEKQKQKLIDQLKDVINERFDLIVQRKQISYEKLLEHLEELKKRAQEGKVEIEQFTNEKNQKVEERVKRLLSQKHEFNWE
jgi:hypothetical protein